MVVIAAVFVAGFLVLSGLQSDLTAGTSAYNATTEVTTGLTNIVSYAPTWGTIIGVAILLAIIVGGFAFGRSRGYF